MKIGRRLGITFCFCGARRSNRWVALALVPALFGGLQPRAIARPNIVIIMSDDAGYNEVGFNSMANGGSGNAPAGRTPNLDALAAQSIVARQGYSAAPLCSVARAGLLTGQYPQRFGFEENLSGFANAVEATGDWGLNQQQITIAQHLKTLGYSTGLIGKWHVGYKAGLNLPRDKGFDEFYGIWNGGRSTYFPTPFEFEVRRVRKLINGVDVDWENNWGSEGDHSLYDTNYDPNQVNEPPRRYFTDALGEEAADYINRHANDANPFFLMVPLTAPHTPLDYKQSDYNHFPEIADPTKRVFAAMNYAMDRAAGKVIDAIHNNGLDNNTIIVYVNDNGGDFYNDNFPLRGYKSTTFEGGIRVPFTIKIPGVAPGSFQAPISTYDLLPTLVAAAGGDISNIPTDGVNLMPYLSTNSGTPRNKLFWRSFEVWGVRKGDYKLAHLAYGPTGPALFNVAADPSEQNNLIVAEPEIVADLFREFTLWEATLAKPKFGPLSSHSENDFDHFVFRNDMAATGFWSSLDSGSKPAQIIWCG